MKKKLERPPRPVTAPHPGDRQPGEPDSAWAAFVLYRDMGPNLRSTMEVARKLDKTKNVITRWCGRWGWVDRCREWDDEADRIRRESALAEVREMSKRQAEESRGIQVALSAPARELARRIQTKELDLSKLKPQELIKLASAAAPAIARMMENERIARGAQDPATATPTLIVNFGDEALREMQSMVAAVAPHLTLDEQERLIEQHSRLAGVTIPDGPIIEAEAKHVD